MKLDVDARRRIGAYVRRARLDLDLRIEDAAERAGGMSPTTWSRVEEGHPARNLTYARIARALGWTSGSLEVIASGGEPRAAVQASATLKASSHLTADPSRERSKAESEIDEPTGEDLYPDDPVFAAIYDLPFPEVTLFQRFAAIEGVRMARRKEEEAVRKAERQRERERDWDERKHA